MARAAGLAPNIPALHSSFDIVAAQPKGASERPGPVVPQIVRAATDVFDAIQRGFIWLDEHRDDVKGFLRRAEWHTRRGAWSYLLQQVPAVRAIATATVIELGVRTRSKSDPVADEVVENSLKEMLEEGLTERGLIREASAALDRIQTPAERREQLQVAVGYIGERRYHLAGPMLINPLEGAFWDLAAERGLISRDRKGKWVATETTGKPGKKIGGVEALFDLPGLEIDESYARFLRGLAYGGAGHRYRHGAASGWPLRTLCLFVSLLGWLELQGEFDSKSEVRAAFHRADDERRAGETAEQAA